MKTIICPHCKKEFSMEKNDYEEIVKQLFEGELNERLEKKEQELNKEKQYELETLKNQQKIDITNKESELNSQIEKLKNQIESLEKSKTTDIEVKVKNKELELRNEIENERKKLSDKEYRISNLESELDRVRAEQDRKIKDLTERYEEKLSAKEGEKNNAVDIAEAKIRETLNKEINDKLFEIQSLKGKLNSFEAEQQKTMLATVAQKNDEIRNKDVEIATLLHKLDTKEKELETQELQLKDKYDSQLKSKDEMIAYYKDMKTSLSTKMVGESLEEHCRVEFEKLRQTGFQRAYFEKDNDIRNGSKGDFIFRDYDENGEEIVSIMFEMKNENETTATKRKNEDFLKELDKDRKDKNCEYAVLVSLLEQDSELYNIGIVDMSHKYEKMYVIRPQFFIPIITLIRNASTKVLDYKNQLTLVRNQNIDITNFENEINTFKEKFSKNVEVAKNHFCTAIDEIDKSISHLQKIKESLTKSMNQLGYANDKANDLSVRNLTKNNPTMIAMFDKLKENK